MDATPPQLLASYLAYLRESGVTHFCGEEGAFFRQPAAPQPSPPPRPSPAPKPAPPPPAPRPTPTPPPPPSSATDLPTLRDQVAACTRCALARTRTQTVFGVGSDKSDVVFVGEAPGAEEDRLGEPFVGPSGKLLDRMLAAIGRHRGQIYIANVLKCRPPGNRNPSQEEMELCRDYLFGQLEQIRPRAIFALGRFAIMTLLNLEVVNIGALRGKIHYWRGIPVIASYHPSFYLRSPSRKRAAWEDLLLLEDLLSK